MRYIPSIHSLLLWRNGVFIKKPPSNIVQPYVFNPMAKPTRHNPQPNNAPTGKRKRQWR